MLGIYQEQHLLLFLFNNKNKADTTRRGEHLIVRYHLGGLLAVPLTGKLNAYLYYTENNLVMAHTQMQYFVEKSQKNTKIFTLNDFVTPDGLTKMVLRIAQIVQNSKHI